MAKRRLEYLLLLLTVLLFHILLVNYLSFYLLLFFLILPVLSLVGLLLSGRAVRVELKGADRAATRGKAVPFAMAVENGGFISAGGVAVRLEIINQFTQARQEEELFLPGSRGRWEVERQLTSQHCGQLACRILELRIYDYLGLFYLRRRAGKGRGKPALASETLTLTVFPNTRPLPQLSEVLPEREEMENLEERYAPSQAGDDPAEIHEIRAFRDGDRPSRIYWKLSGKLEETMVKEYGQPLANRPLFLVELNGDQEELDGLLDTLVSIAQQLLWEEIPYLLQWYDTEHHTIVRQEIESREELDEAFSLLLSGGRRQSRPTVLEEFCSEGPFAGYSRVLYLCSRTEEEAVTLLGRSLPGQTLHILQVTDASERRLNPKLAVSLEAGLTLLRPDTLSEDLARFSLS